MQTTDKLSALSNNTLGDIIVELGKQFVKTDGSNVTEAGAKAILDKLTGNDQVAKVSDLTTKVNITGDNATEDGVTAMLDKLTDKVLKVDGSNATDPGVTAMLGKLTDKVVKTADLATKVAEKAVMDVLVPALATGADDKGIYTKKGVNDELAKKADADGSNATDPGVTAMLEKLTDKVVKTSELKTKAAEKPVVDAIIASTNFPKFVKESELKTKAAEKPVVDAIIASTDFPKFVKESELKTKAAEKPVVDAIIASTDFPKFVKESELKTKVAEKAVVDVLVPALATVGTDDTKKVYTRGTADTSFVKTDGSNANAIAAALTKNPTFINTAKTEVNAQDAGFQGAVREVMLQPIFEIPTSDDVALNWTW